MVLWGNTLMFYKNENLVECETPGDRECMYLLETSVVKHLSFGDEDNSFLLFYPFSPIKLTAQSRSHTIKWLVSFSKIIAKLGRSPLLKGELFKLSKSNPENKKRFIVFHDTSVAVYRQEGDLALPAYSAQPLLPGESDVQFLDAEEEIIITEIRPSHDDKRRQ